MTKIIKKSTLLSAAKLLLSTTAIVGIALSSSAAFAVVSLPAPNPSIDVSIPAPQPPIGVIGPVPTIGPVADVLANDVSIPAPQPPIGVIGPVPAIGPVPNPDVLADDESIPAPQPPIGVIGPVPAIGPVSDDQDPNPPNPVPAGGVVAGIDQSDVFEAFATFAAGGDGLRVIYTTIGNSQNLANISPAAGGTSAEALAGINPAAGGNDNTVERTESSSSDSCWAEGASRSAGAFGANITTNFDQCE